MIQFNILHMGGIIYTGSAPSKWWAIGEHVTILSRHYQIRAVDTDISAVYPVANIIVE